MGIAGERSKAFTRLSRNRPCWRATSEKTGGRGVMQGEDATTRGTTRRSTEPLMGDMAQLEAQIEQLMGRLRLAVIFGGNKLTPGGVVYASRNTRSWKSYEAVATDIAEALRRLG